MPHDMTTYENGVYATAYANLHNTSLREMPTDAYTVVALSVNRLRNM